MLYAPGCSLGWRDDGLVPEWALGPGRLDALRAFLAAGADINATLRDGRTPLMFAADNGNVDVVRELVAAGANVDAATVSGETALMGAARFGRIDVVRLLLEAGADPHKRQYSSEWRFGKSARDVTTSQEVRAMLPEVSWPGLIVKGIGRALRYTGALARQKFARWRGDPA